MEEGPYLIATTHAGIVLGLSHEVAVKKGILEKKDVFGNVDDSYVQPVFLTFFLQGSQSIVRIRSQTGVKKLREKGP